MRKILFLLLAAALVWLIVARGALPEPAAEAMAGAPGWDGDTYNVLDWDLSSRPETAGRTYFAEMDRYFLSRTPTAKHSRTGLLAGENLLLVLAEDWRPGDVGAGQTPVLYKLWSEGIRFADYYAPDWYQGQEGRLFALLTGLTPTTVENRTSLALLGEQDVLLPFALARGLGACGYTCRACPGADGQDGVYAALGFSSVRTSGAPGDGLAELAESEPFFVCAVLDEEDGEAALEAMWQALEEAGLTERTAVCVVTGSGQSLRGGLFLWGPGLEPDAVAAPCSDLDVTPTLLDLFGAAYDSRFLSGRDVLADGTAGGPVPLVSLYGSAYSDWVTDAGRYTAADDRFLPADGRFGGTQQQDRYVSENRQAVYDRYVFSRRILESNYFRLVMGR